MLTIGQLAKRFGLSRATLLYYEREGLLEPASRAANGYRWYGDREIDRLSQVVGFRSYGVSVADIRKLLQHDSKQEHERILHRRFRQLETDIQDLRRQQQDLVAILGQSQNLTGPAMDKEHWTGIMRAAGMSDDDMHHWHREFETREPRAHQEFLESLNLDDTEIRQIRQWSRD